MKSQKIALLAGLTVILTSFSTFAAQARTDLLNQALNQSLQEKAEVQKTYKDTKSAARADERANAQPARSISIEMGDEIGSGGSDRASFRAERSDEKIEREDISNFDKELRDADHNLDDSRKTDKLDRR